MTIKELRVARKLTQAQLAKMLGVSAGVVSHLENGRMQISDRIADKIWEVSGVEVRDPGEKKLVKKAWGFSGLYKNVDHRDKTAARQSVSSYFGRGNGQYYRAHHGEILLSPKQQEDILRIVSQFGPLDGIKFDRYTTDWDFE